MKIISLIAAVDENYALGKDNQLLCYLPADLQHFKKMTTGKSVIMGRKTFLSIGKPLPHRQNIVLTSRQDSIEGVQIAHSLKEALNLAQLSDEVMIIGGGDVFLQFLPLADSIYLTVIHHQFDADIYFPSIEKAEWECTILGTHGCDEKNSYSMTFYHYARK